MNVSLATAWFEDAGASTDAMHQLASNMCRPTCAQFHKAVSLYEQLCGLLVAANSKSRAQKRGWGQLGAGGPYTPC